MQHITYTTTQRSQSRSWKAIARRLTGMELEQMLESYRAGEGKIAAPRGHTLTRSAFEQLCNYVGVSA